MVQSFVRRVPGDLVEMKKNPSYYWSGSTVKEYSNGAYVEEKPGVFRFQDYGEPEGEPVLTLTRGPHMDLVSFKVYDEQKAAVTDLRSHLIDYILNPRASVPNSENSSRVGTSGLLRMLRTRSASWGSTCGVLLWTLRSSGRR